MSSTEIPAEPETLAAVHLRNALYFQAMLVGIADHAATLTQLVVAEAKSLAAAGEPVVDTIVAYERVTRSLRRTILLAQKLTAPAPVVPAARPEQDRIAARKTIIRRVEDAIHRGAPADEAESLRAELLERLDAPEFDDDLAQRSISDKTGELCNDLGVAGPQSLELWMRRTPADIAILCKRAAAPCRTVSGPIDPPERRRDDSVEMAGPWRDDAKIRGP